MPKALVTHRSALLRMAERMRRPASSSCFTRRQAAQTGPPPSLYGFR